VVTLGLPDFRAVFLVPIGFLWTGSVLAAKVATILLMSAAVWACHTWRRQQGESESALIASGLLLISPLVISQIDTISVAAYLLLTFGLGAWSDHGYRKSPLPFGGLYFLQLFLCLVSVTLHPIGLAYPMVLLWAWYKNPIDSKQRNYFLGGVGFVVVLALFLTQGWHHVGWFSNPIKSLSSLLIGAPDGGDSGVTQWIAGIGVLFVLALVIWENASALWKDFLGQVLLLGLVIGLFTGDDIFNIVALVICLYWGLPLLLFKPQNTQSGFWGQRGLAFVVTFILATTFMVFDKMSYLTVQSGELNPREALIKSLAEDSGNVLNIDATQTTPPKKPVRVASQWPALTMLICKCDALPLPPAAKNNENFLAMLKGISYLIFDPRDPANSSLSRTLATMDAGKVETTALMQGGVVVEIKQSPSAK
jgi:hypothetical protein